MEQIKQNTESFASTIYLNNLIGAQVIASNGIVIGTVSHVTLSRKKMQLEGIVVVSRNLFQSSLYIDRTYFQKLSTAAIVLTIEPSVLLKGRKVITFEGQIVGKVTNVKREEQTNEIKTLNVKPKLRKPFTLSPENVKYFGKSIILEEGVDVPKTKVF